MIVSEAKPGEVIETLTDSGFPTGNVYKIGKGSNYAGRIEAWRNFRQGKTFLFPQAKCRKLDTNPNLIELSF